MALRILGLALEFVVNRWTAIVRTMVVPLILLLVVGALDASDDNARLPAAALPVAQILILSWFLVALHRVMLVGVRARAGADWPQLRYAAMLVAAGAILTIGTKFIVGAFESIGMPTQGIVAAAFYWLVAAGILYWISQYMLVLPATVVNRRYTPRHSAVDVEEHRVSTFLIALMLLILVLCAVGVDALASNAFLVASLRAVTLLVCATFAGAILSAFYSELATDESSAR